MQRAKVRGAPMTPDWLVPGTWVELVTTLESASYVGEVESVGEWGVSLVSPTQRVSSGQLPVSDGPWLFPWASTARVVRRTRPTETRWLTHEEAVQKMYWDTDK